VLLPKFRERLGPSGYRWNYNENKKTIFVRCGMNNWSEIVIKSEEADPDSYEGAKVHRLAFDEEPSERIFDQALVRTIDTRGQVLVAATMWEMGISWLYDRMILPVIEGRPEAEMIDLVGQDLPMESNPMLDPEEIRQQRARAQIRSPEEAAVRFDGKYIPVTGKTPWNISALELFRTKRQPFEEVEVYDIGGAN
jgi:hypothetical protein